MTHLPGAPLVYTFAVVRFPKVPIMERLAPEFHNAIRSAYPHDTDLKLEQMQVEFGPHGVSLKPTPLVIWQFASPDRKLAVILTADTIALHTVAYRDHRTFIEAFESVLRTLLALKGIGIDWVNAAAMRYIDLVAPQAGEGLDQLLKPSVLPVPFTDVAGLDIVDGTYVAKYRMAKTDVRFQIFRNPPEVLPADLITPLVGINNWRFERPTTEFAVVDTDCSRAFPEPMAMDVGSVCGHMYELRNVAKSIFLKIGTEHAEKVWSGAGQ
jgi:uncharacterized protein (TIGR04255 family)